LSASRLSRTRHPRWRANATACIIGIAVTGCESVLGIDFDAVEQAPNACHHASPNPPPAVQNAGGDIEFTAVVIDAQYGDGVDANGKANFLSQGYDLDGLCTGPNGPASCTPPAWVGYPETDGTDGRDNGVGRMFSAQNALFGLTLVSSDYLSPLVNSGEHAPNGIIRVRGYNGFHEDDQVEVDWFVALAPAAQGDGSFAPKFDGSDVWPLDADTLDGTTDDGAPRSLYRDTAAYVSAYQLVAHFPRVQIPLANIYFEAHDVILTSQITETATTATMLKNGILAGTIPMATFLDVIPLTAAAITGQTSLCRDSPLYPDIKHFICVADDSPLDRPSGGECDAGSFGIAFATAPVVLGSSGPPPVPENPCEDPPDTCSAPAR
jgi:hypothetical protein